MTAYTFVYIFLAIALAAMVYVVGTPWMEPKPRKVSRKKVHKHSWPLRR